MLITIIVGMLLALIFGKITVKEVKAYVRKYTTGKRDKAGEENVLTQGKKREEQDCGTGN